jgi:hypothetical protein
LKKGAHIHVAGYLRLREIEKKATGRGKKSGADGKVPIQTKFVPNPTSALGGVKWCIYNELVFYSVTMWTSPPSFGGALSPPREF